LESVFSRKGGAICAVVHTAAQPSHDWARATRRPISALMPTARSTCLKPRAGTVRMRLLYLQVQTRSMATRPTCCRWSKRRLDGR
jgi:hypothetical protein